MKLLRIGMAVAAALVSQYAFTSTDGAFQTVLDRNGNAYIAKDDCSKRIRFSGVFRGLAGMKTPVDSSGKYASDITITRMTMLMDADVNEWTTAHFGTNLATILSRYELDAMGSLVATNKDLTVSNFDGPSGIFMNSNISEIKAYGFIEEAFVTFGNLEKTPVYFRVGYGNTPFGLYERNNTPAKYTTLLTATSAVSAQIGFADVSGFFGTGYVFRGMMKQSDKDGKAASNDSDSDRLPNVNNGGVSVGFSKNFTNWGATVVVDWVYNYMGSLNLLRYLQGIRVSSYSAVHQDKNMGLHAALKAHYENFDMSFNYVRVMRKVHAKEAFFPGKNPAALDLELGVKFPINGKKSRFSMNYQHCFDMTGSKGQFGYASPLVVTPAVLSTSGTIQNPAVINPLAVYFSQVKVQGNLTIEVVKDVILGAHFAWKIGFKGLLDDGVRPKGQYEGMLSLTARIS